MKSHLKHPLGFIIISLVLVFLLSISVVAQDTAIVKIMVDLEGVRTFLDHQFQDTDSYGNSLVQGQWFLLIVPAGNHTIEFRLEDSTLADTSFDAAINEIISLTMKFEGPEKVDIQPAAPLPDSMGTLFILSDPDSAVLLFDQEDTDQITPALFTLDPGTLEVEAVVEGFEPLSQRIEIVSGRRLRAMFLLKTLQPPSLAAESLGLQILPERPTRNLEEADLIMKRFTGLAESFAIVPFSQGILAKMFAGESSQDEADILLIAGTVLSLGSYLLGRVLSSRKERQINLENEIIEKNNLVARENNTEIKKVLRIANAERIDLWRSQNEGRGLVELHSDEDND